MKKQQIAVLGSTGSIGRQTLEIIEANSDRYAVFSLAANKNVSLLEEQINKFRPQIVHVSDGDSADKLRKTLRHVPVRILTGDQGIWEAAASEKVDIVVVAISGIAGLLPTLAAVNAGKRIALANKESLVAAGGIVTEKARQKQATIIPVDSEHSAVFQCLQGKKKEIHRIILTASGGPFRNSSLEEINNATPQEALSHPNWSMGKRITVDSATLMNKGLEIIEAKWLFDMPYERIDVLIHPQSIIHSMVEYIDGSVLANLGVPSMKVPIQYALTWPERTASDIHLNFTELKALTFEEPKRKLFPCLELARSAGIEGGIMPAVLNAADEVAVKLFLQNKISFSAIPVLIERTLESFSNKPADSIDTVLDADREARKRAADLAKV
jgi:1-deoxy-D-xylulose-5-phosphate reductoisomerase